VIGADDRREAGDEIGVRRLRGTIGGRRHG
jgi:hypothetical protein